MLVEKLKKRAEAGLSNKAEEIAPEHISEALSDMEEIVAGRTLQTPFKIDIAYYRLLLILDAHISEDDNTLYASALKELKSAPKIIDEDEGQSFAFMGVKQRENIYQ